MHFWGNRRKHEANITLLDPQRPKPPGPENPPLPKKCSNQLFSYCFKPFFGQVRPLGPPKAENTQKHMRLSVSGRECSTSAAKHTYTHIHKNTCKMAPGAQMYTPFNWFAFFDNGKFHFGLSSNVDPLFCIVFFCVALWCVLICGVVLFVFCLLLPCVVL